ncbi:MAG: transglycosylase SLT domain-containing protein [Alphaproteobacteria bacterium]|nr:transglycosylase SLT domain-containing protein [Alphaproteobacteria bacterium]
MSITSRQRQRGIPPELLARLFHRESDFKNQGVDRNGNATGGPVGIPQMYPDALRSVGVDPATFARAGAAAQIDAGAAYLAQQYRTFGYWPMAVAAYQFGPGRVANWLSGSGPTYENIEQRAQSESANYRGKTDAPKERRKEEQEDREKKAREKALDELKQWEELQAYLPYMFLGDPNKYDRARGR